MLAYLQTRQLPLLAPLVDCGLFDPDHPGDVRGSQKLRLSRPAFAVFHSHLVPLLQMRSLPWLRCSLYYTDSSFHDYTPFYFYVLDFSLFYATMLPIGKRDAAKMRG